MRIVVVVGILSVVFGSDSEFLFKSGAEQDSGVFKAPNSAESYLQQTEQTEPINFAWWTGQTDNDPVREQNARGKWSDPVFFPQGYYGCGFDIVYDTTFWMGNDNSGIKEMGIVACDGRPYSTPDPDYRPKGVRLTGWDMYYDNIDSTKEWGKRLICNENSAIQGYNIRHEFVTDRSDNVGMTELEFSCAKGEDKKHDKGNDWGEWLGWRKFPGYYVCGAKVKYEPFYNGIKDETRLNLLDLAICARWPWIINI